MRIYSDKTRETDAYALPDVEIFHSSTYGHDVEDDDDRLEPGWYYWYCFPGCLPDSEPIGPFASAEEAEEAAQDEDDEWTEEAEEAAQDEDDEWTEEG